MPPKADSSQTSHHVRFVPLAEVALIRSTRRDRATTWLRWSFGQPGLPQSFLVSREVFGMPIRANHVFETGNTQRGIELPQPSHCLMCFVQPSRHCIASGVDT